MYKPIGISTVYNFIWQDGYNEIYKRDVDYFADYFENLYRKVNSKKFWRIF